MDRNKREKLKRQATAAAVATVASASVMVGGILPDDGVFDDGAEDFPTPIVETVPLRGAGGDAPETGTVAGSEEEKKKAQRTAARFARLPFGARVLVAAGIGGAAWLTASGASALLAAALPAAAAAVLGWGLTVLALAAGFAAFVKAFFPEKRLRDIVKKKNLWWLLGGAAALAAAPPRVSGTSASGIANSLVPWAATMWPLRRNTTRRPRLFLACTTPLAAIQSCPCTMSNGRPLYDSSSPRCQMKLLHMLFISVMKSG